MVRSCIDTNGRSVHYLKAIASNSFASSPAARGSWRLVLSSDLGSALYYDAHPVGLDDGDRCLRGDEFAFGDDINHVIGETRFAARSQHSDCGALHSGGERERGRELS